MIIVRVPKGEASFVTNVRRKLRRNQKHRKIRLRGEIAYSDQHAYFVFPDGSLEAAFALSIYMQCERRRIPCQLYLAEEASIEDFGEEVVECAEAWSWGKLPRRCYPPKRSTG